MATQVEEIRIGADPPLFAKLRLAAPDAPAILLLPGLGFHTFETDELAGRLGAAGYTSLALDYRGHGRSGGRRGAWTLTDLVDDAGRGVDHLADRAPAIGVLGNSLGAIVAVELAARDPRVRSVVASGCPTRVADFAATPLRRALLGVLTRCERILPVRVSVNHFIPYRLILRDRKVIARVRADPLVADARRFAPSTYRDMFSWNALPAARRLTAPLLVLHGELDDVQPFAQSMLLYAAAGGPREIHGVMSGHVPTLEAPELVEPLVVAWFDRTLRSARAVRRGA